MPDAMHTAKEHQQDEHERTILLAVTVDMSLVLIEDFALYLRDLGWNTHVISSPGPRADRLRASGVHVHTVRMARDPSPFLDLISTFDWIRVLAHVRPDIVMSGTPKAGLLGMLSAWLVGVPDRVYVMRGLRLETSRGLLRAVLVRIEKLAFALSSRAIAVGPSLRNEVVRLNLTTSDKISVIGKGSSNGVDPERFRPRGNENAEVLSLRDSVGLRPGTPTLGFVGRLSPDKGLDTLEAALEILEKRDLAFQLLLVGGQDGTRVGSGARPGSSIRIMQTGQVSDTSKYYALIDVLCLPTRREGFPNVVLEAAASGVPAITTNATGAIDSVVHGTTGLIVNVDDPEELADAVEHLLSNSEIREKMGRDARAWAIENFGQLAVWDRTVEFLTHGRDVVPSKQGGGRTGDE